MKIKRTVRRKEMVIGKKGKEKEVHGAEVQASPLGEKAPLNICGVEYNWIWEMWAIVIRRLS